MTEKATRHLERRELGGMYVEAITIGKHKEHPERNEDTFVATPTTFAVIDGSAPRLPLKWAGHSSAQFATNALKEVLETTSPTLNGVELVAAMTKSLNEHIDQIGAGEIVKDTPEARPAALFTAARIVGDKLVITGVGDIACRINGQLVHNDLIITEELMIKKRIAAMKQAVKEDPNLSEEELKKLGKAAIEDDLKTQVKNYFNNGNNDLGLGIVDGDPVPDKFVKTYEFDLSNVETLELFSDGYYAVPTEPSIEVFEEAFFISEEEDPLRWDKYPAVKVPNAQQFSDDRTILIAKTKPE